MKNNIRALPLQAIEHPAQIDHYINSTVEHAEIVIVRLLGGRGHWSYGLEQLSKWQAKFQHRCLIVISGTTEHEDELNELSTINIETTRSLGELLREGGVENITTFLNYLIHLESNEKNSTYNLLTHRHDDPFILDWLNESGPKVGIIFYRSLFLAGDTKVLREINKKLREAGLAPRCLCVSSLRNMNVINRVNELFRDENIEIIITEYKYKKL